MPLYDLAFYFIIFFLVGVVFASVGFSLLVVLGVVLSGALAIFFVLSRHYATLFLIPSVLLGFVYFNIYSDIFYIEHIPLEEKAVFQGVVAREPVYGLTSQRLAFKLQPPHRGEVMVYTAPYPRYVYGDLLAVTGTVEKSASGALNIMSFPEVTHVASGKGNAVKQALFTFKRRFVANLERVLPPEEAALLAGETVGDRAGFSKPFTEAMKLSGTTHIVALSGHNISVVIFAVMWAFGFFFSRRVSFYASVFFITLFVVMTGAEASVVRAGIMGILILLAVQADRLYSVRNALALTAFGMTLHDPRVLVFDVGFQLSFGALLGIVYFMPLLKHFFNVNDEGFLGWKYNALTTVSAQIGVLPLLLYHFGYFSLLSIAANVLILEAVPYTMGLGFLTGFTGFASDALSQVFARSAHLLLYYQIAVISFFSNIPWGISLTSLPWTALGIYYGFLAWGMIYGYRKYKLTPTL